MSDYPQSPDWVRAALHEGLVIPAHPLALTMSRQLDEQRQRALTRYYCEAGAGGLAVGVHTTQFSIRDPKHGLLAPVLALAAETARSCDGSSGRSTVLIAGICGGTAQAVAEAKLARTLGYHVGLLSLAALPDSTVPELLRHCDAVAREIPLFGFYLQPAAGGHVLPFEFWREFARIPNVAGIKIAPFQRYHTIDVLRGVAESERCNEIALYTGNDDHILLDLLTEHRLPTATGEKRLLIAGGLLGHWACWTLRAVEQLRLCKQARSHASVPAELLRLSVQVTDCNAAFFDARNGFRGCIPGIHEVLHRQGLLANTLCLDPKETLSPDQAVEIDRVYRAYPELNDDSFVAAHLDRWLT
ncbi:MAG: dihydrodipicolinate synthase family protein [Verrucomicrobia bacterium]|nr:dihydrodipicolinate synthase family protein [Verrucomicrobiota bacterium]